MGGDGTTSLPLVVSRPLGAVDRGPVDEQFEEAGDRPHAEQSPDDDAAVAPQRSRPQEQAKAGRR
jgi:hypothetical protein